MHIFKKALLPLMATAAIVGCSNENVPFSDTEKGAGDPAIPRAIFDLSGGVLPSAINVAFSGSLDGSLNAPIADDASESTAAVTRAINTQDGFSTTSPVTTSFSVPVDITTVQGGGVRVFEVSLDPLNGYAVTGVTRELTENLDFALSLDSAKTTLIMLPLTPLKGSSLNFITRTPIAVGYSVVLTNAIKTVDGGPVGSDANYIIIKSDDPESIVKNGKSISPSLDDTRAAGLEALRQLTQAREGFIAASGGPAIEDMILSWTFKTQDIGTALVSAGAATLAEVGTMYDGNTATNAFELPDFEPLGDLGGVLQGSVAYQGVLKNVPYYLGSGANALTQFWEADDTKVLVEGAPKSKNLLAQNGFTPLKKGTVDIPVLVTIPAVGGVAQGLNTRSATPGNFTGGLPVAIYQHGITTNRGTLAFMADNLAAQGMAGIAIDLPLHGISETDSTYSTFKPIADHAKGVLGLANERTFGDADGDGTIDTSGQFFINATSLATSRDNIRQGVSDLIALRGLLPLFSVDTDAGNPATALPDFSTSEVRFIGMSLGTAIGIPYVDTQTKIKPLLQATYTAAGGAAAALAPVLAPAQTTIERAVYNVPAAGIPKMLDSSASFGPRLSALIDSETNGAITKPSSGWDRFLGAAATLLDSADPINYASSAALQSIPTLVQQIVGDIDNNYAACDLTAADQSGCPDQTNTLHTLGALAVSPLAASPSLSGFTLEATPSPERNFFLPGTQITTTPAVLGGSDNLNVGMGLTRVTQAGGAGSGYVQYTQGIHASLLLPTGGLSVADFTALAGANPAAAAALSNRGLTMQLHMAAFLGTGNILPAATISGVPNAALSGAVNLDGSIVRN